MSTGSKRHTTLRLRFSCVEAGGPSPTGALFGLFGDFAASDFSADFSTDAVQKSMCGKRIDCVEK